MHLTRDRVFVGGHAAIGTIARDIIVTQMIKTRRPSCVDSGWRQLPSAFCEVFVTSERRTSSELAYEIRWEHRVLSSISQGSPAALAILSGCFLLVLVFEFSNGFHDTANAVATVIYTNSLKPTYAVAWSGLMNFLGVIGGIAVAYALVELIPAEVLSPPNGGIAAGMLAALFTSALLWNVGTWWLGIPTSSSHAIIGSLIGIAIETALTHGRGLTHGVDRQQVWNILGSLLLSPIIGFGLAFLLFKLLSMFIRDRHLYEPPEGDRPPVWWIRYLLILTCTGVSFAHGTNDGQKSIGLIMLTIIGLMPADYALNMNINSQQIAVVTSDMPAAAGLMERFRSLSDHFGHIKSRFRSGW
jgi:PiT family inorganic phosphate transporter